MIEGWCAALAYATRGRPFVFYQVWRAPFFGDGRVWRSGALRGCEVFLKTGRVYMDSNSTCTRSYGCRPTKQALGFTCLGFRV